MNSGKDVRTRVIETLQRYKVKQIDVARQTGMHHSTLCLWLQGKIRGHQVKIEETLERWLDNFNENKPQIPKGSITKGFGAKPSENKDAVVEVDKAEPVSANVVREDEIIPVRIDVESEGRRFRENICWNVNETQITPEYYAKQVADDNGLPPVCESEISSSIKKAIQAYRRYVPLVPEMIKVIELDIRVENICLKDRFEWDINDPKNVPEEFALNLCNELGLDFEFLGLIAHSIREQIQTHQKQAMERGFAEFGSQADMFLMKKSTRSLIESGSSITKKTLEQVVINEDNYLRNLQTENVGHQFEVNNQNVWEPRIEVLDLKDIERMKKLEERKNRYEKRHR